VEEAARVVRREAEEDLLVLSAGRFRHRCRRRLWRHIPVAVGVWAVGKC
jgi:hypothetical protein